MASEFGNAISSARKSAKSKIERYQARINEELKDKLEKAARKLKMELDAIDFDRKEALVDAYENRIRVLSENVEFLKSELNENFQNLKLQSQEISLLRELVRTECEERVSLHRRLSEVIRSQ
jgi:hypothetical protein